MKGLSLDLNVIVSTVIMSRRKNGANKARNKKLTELSNLKKKLRKNPDDDALRSKIKTIISRL